MKIEKKINYNYSIIEDSKTNEEYFGGNQDWYKICWRRKAGCGPTTASTITMYEERKNYNSNKKYQKEEFLELMNELWNYVTPTPMGVNKIELFIDGYDKYVKDNKLNLQSRSLKIEEDKTKRPNIEKLYEFLKEGIENNHPIAFLNLDNGQEKNLDEWHWVTIVGVDYDDENRKLNATIADEGKQKNIDLNLWLNTTTKEGGFVYYDNLKC